jgi:hypothetical protein
MRWGREPQRDKMFCRREKPMKNCGGNQREFKNGGVWCDHSRRHHHIQDGVLTRLERISYGNSRVEIQLYFLHSFLSPPRNANG